MDRRKILILLSVIFLLSFGVKSVAILSESTVPPGWVDTAYHTSTSIDVSEGDFDSLIHPWWHIKENSEIVDGLKVIDRNSVTFYYPPFLHLFTAAFMLFMSAGTATIISISLIYSLSVPAVYLLSRSYDLDRDSSLISAAVVAGFPALLHSQVMGFWSFAGAFIFGLISFSFYRLYRKKQDPKFIAGYIVAGVLASLTHWVFGAFVVGMPVLDRLVEDQQFDWKIPLLALSALLPNYIVFFATSNIGSYITTSFDRIFPSVSPVVIVAGIIVSRGKYRTIDLFASGSLVGAGIYYMFDLAIPFGDMIQFALPLLAGFYAGSLYSKIDRKKVKNIFKGLTLLLILVGFWTQFFIGQDSTRSVNEKEFQQLVEMRDEIPDKIIAGGNSTGSWLTIASGERKIVSPYDDFNPSKLNKNRFHYLNIEE